MLPKQRAAQRATSADSADSRSLAERCISWGNVGPPMVPPTYNANLEILQSSDLVLIRHEMMHDARLIYLDGRPHPPPSLQWLAGHSVGHFEGQTLVVDTTNFTALTNFRGSPGNSRQDIFASERLHVVERFTRTGEETIHYSFTVDDPDTWVSPWAGEMEMRTYRGADLRVRLPRRQSRARQHSARRARRGTPQRPVATTALECPRAPHGAGTSTRHSRARTDRRSGRGTRASAYWFRRASRRSISSLPTHGRRRA